MILRIVPLALAALIASPGGQAGDEGKRPLPPRIIEVRMVDKSPTEFVFQPSDVKAAPGDVIRFVQTGVMPHNVEFVEAPATGMPDSLRMGPYLIRAGATYDIAVDDRLPPGAYPFVCTPHAPLGMKGTLTVQPATPDTEGGEP